MNLQHGPTGRLNWQKGRNWALGWIPFLREDERGQTLPAELVALAIIATAIGLLLTALAVGSSGVKTKHQRTTASGLAVSQLEIIAAAAYSPDPTAVPYPTVSPRQGYSVEVNVEYWTAPDGPFTSTPRDDGLQRVTVSVAGTEGDILQIQAYKGDR